MAPGWRRGPTGASGPRLAAAPAETEPCPRSKQSGCVPTWACLCVRSASRRPSVTVTVTEVFPPRTRAEGHTHTPPDLLFCSLLGLAHAGACLTGEVTLCAFFRPQVVLHVNFFFKLFHVTCGPHLNCSNLLLKKLI